MPSKVKPVVSKPKRSLSQFVLDKKRSHCPVCSLPDAVSVEIRDARTKKITRPVILEWLEKEYRIKITSADFDRHYSARHETTG